MTKICPGKAEIQAKMYGFLFLTENSEHYGVRRLPSPHIIDAGSAWLYLPMIQALMLVRIALFPLTPLPPPPPGPAGMDPSRIPARR